MKNKKILIVSIVVILFICIGLGIYNFTLNKNRIAKLEELGKTLTTEDGFVTTKDHLAQTTEKDKQIEELSSTNTSNATEIKNLNSKITTLNSQISSLNTQVSTLTTQKSSLQTEYNNFKTQISNIAKNKGQTPASTSNADIIAAVSALSSGTMKVSSGIPTTSYTTKGIVVASVYRGLISGNVTDSATLTIKKNNATLKTITCSTTCDTSVYKVPGSANMVTEQFEVDLGPSNTYSFSITNGNQHSGGYGYSCYTIYQ